MDNKLIFENWRRFLAEDEDETLAGELQKGKQLGKKAEKTAEELSPEHKEALQQLQKILPALAVAALDVETEETNEALSPSMRKMRRGDIFQAMNLPRDTKKSTLDAEQRAIYSKQFKIWNDEDNRQDFMQAGFGGQHALLMTRLDELPGIKRIPGITAALTALFQTDDVTILSAIEALSSITGPLGI